MTQPLKFNNEYLYPHVIPHWAKFNPKGVAVICDDESRTWPELERRTSKVANALIAAGVKKDVKVCLFMRNSMINFELFWGIVRSGGVIVALNPMMQGEALANMINKSDGVLLFTDADELPTIEPIADQLHHIPRERIYVAGGAPGWNSAEAFIEAGDPTPVNVQIDPQDSINIVYTSGSTGTPKGTEHAHIARHQHTFGAGHWFGFDRRSVTILASQLFANGTWVTMGPTLYRGGTVVLQRKFSGEDFIRLVEKHRATHAFLVPTMTIQILAALKPEHDMSSFRVLYSSGQPLMPQTIDDIARLLPKAELWELYGQSEGWCTVMGPKDRVGDKRGSVGFPSFLDDVRVVDDDGNDVPAGEIGEICGYSMNLMKGYYKDPENTAKATWVSPEGRTYIRSGDLGRIDEDGFLWLAGRKKDMIKSGGLNIFAADLEAELTKHPAVHEAAAIGIPHPKWVETPLAFVILKDGAEATAEEILAWTNARLNKFQRLSAVELVEDLPRVTYGKVDKPKLRAKYWPATAN